MFYSPKQNSIVKRQGKKRKLDSTTITTHDNKPMDVLWKESPINPSAKLTRLSQFQGAYDTTTINKAIEVKMLLKEK